MITRVLAEHGYEEALLGLGLSYGGGMDLERMSRVAKRLCDRDGGHNKFLETMCIWLWIRAPRYWWQQFDTYRVGMTKQSESTMHTLMRGPVGRDDFAAEIPETVLRELNDAIGDSDFELAKAILPESFYQIRVVCTNYKSLRNIILQRRNHRLGEWQSFCGAVLGQVEHPELLPALG